MGRWAGLFASLAFEASNTVSVKPFKMLMAPIVTMVEDTRCRDVDIQDPLPGTKAVVPKHITRPRAIVSPTPPRDPAWISNPDAFVGTVIHA